MHTRQMPWDEPSRLAYYGVAPDEHPRSETYELEVPLASHEAAGNMRRDCVDYQDLQAIAAPIVAAELRAMAERCEAVWNAPVTVGDFWDALNRRADELDPQEN